MTINDDNMYDLLYWIKNTWTNTNGRDLKRRTTQIENYKMEQGREGRDLCKICETVTNCLSIPGGHLFIPKVCNSE